MSERKLTKGGVPILRTDIQSMTMFSGWIRQRSAVGIGDWGRSYSLLRFGLDAPVRRWQQRAGTCHDVSRSSTRYGRLQQSRAIANHSPPQLGDRSPNVESASKHTLPFRLSERLDPPNFILVPRRVAIGTLFSPRRRPHSRRRA
jgi:hypothetical protein